jgi:hypothetical protein
MPAYYKDIAVLAFQSNEKKIITDTSDIRDLTSLMEKDGSLKWEIPAGKWIIGRYVCANTGQLLFSHSANSSGPMIDHFSAEATEAHLMYFIDKLEKKLGSLDKTALKYLYGDSYEVRGDLWTPLMQDEFKSRRMYDLTLFLPVFDGYTVMSPDITSRFRFDYRQTLSDLIIDNHYAKAREICRNHGLEFVAEAAGPGMPVHNCPFESLRASGVLSWPRGEFWYKHTQSPDYPKDILQVIKGVACASHIYDLKYVEAESFTTTWLWQDGPGDLKPAADRAFCEGLNRIIFHTSPHVPEAAGRPGWVYSFGTIVNTTLVWWPKSRPFMDYLARCSYMLQQGNFAGDILYFYGDSAPNFVPPKSADPNYIQDYDYDYINADVLVDRLDVSNGKLVLPHGQEYELLVLPESRFMSLRVINKLEELVSNGAVVSGPMPEGADGLFRYEEISQQVREIARRIWGNCDGINFRENKYGKGKVIWGKSVAEILRERGIVPDFQAVSMSVPESDFQAYQGRQAESLDFIHRKTSEADIYFIRNTTPGPLYFEGVFRVSGKIPEIWDPLSGETADFHLYASDGVQTRMPLYLAHSASVFVVFARQSADHAVELKINGQVIFPLEYEEVAPELKPRPLAKYDPLPVLSGTKWLTAASAQYSFVLSSGRKTEIVTETPPPAINLDGPWLVTFGGDRFAPDSTVFDSLYSWSISPDPGIQFFSGIASYRNSFEIDPGDIKEGQPVILDLGRVQEVAEVFINDLNAGILWCEPYRTDITKYIRPGKNSLVIEVANVWANRLCGDARLAPGDRVSNTNITRLPNAWSYPMETIPNDAYNLRESGLLGPVAVRFYNQPGM